MCWRCAVLCCMIFTRMIFVEVVDQRLKRVRAGEVQKNVSEDIKDVVIRMISGLAVRDRPKNRPTHHLSWPSNQEMAIVKMQSLPWDASIDKVKAETQLNGRRGSSAHKPESEQPICPSKEDEKHVDRSDSVCYVNDSIVKKLESIPEHPTCPLKDDEKHLDRSETILYANKFIAVKLESIQVQPTCPYLKDEEKHPGRSEAVCYANASIAKKLESIQEQPTCPYLKDEEKHPGRSEAVCYANVSIANNPMGIWGLLSSPSSETSPANIYRLLRDVTRYLIHLICRRIEFFSSLRTVENDWGLDAAVEVHEHRDLKVWRSGGDVKGLTTAKPAYHGTYRTSEGLNSRFRCDRHLCEVGCKCLRFIGDTVTVKPGKPAKKLESIQEQPTCPYLKDEEKRPGQSEAVCYANASIADNPMGIWGLLSSPSIETFPANICRLLRDATRYLIHVICRRFEFFSKLRTDETDLGLDAADVKGLTTAKPAFYMTYWTSEGGLISRFRCERHLCEVGCKCLRFIGEQSRYFCKCHYGDTVTVKPGLVNVTCNQSHISISVSPELAEGYSPTNDGLALLSSDPFGDWSCNVSRNSIGMYAIQLRHERPEDCGSNQRYTGLSYAITNTLWMVYQVSVVPGIRTILHVPVLDVECRYHAIKGLQHDEATTGIPDLNIYWAGYPDKSRNLGPTVKVCNGACPGRCETKMNATAGDSEEMIHLDLRFDQLPYIYSGIAYMNVTCKKRETERTWQIIADGCNIDSHLGSRIRYNFMPYNVVCVDIPVPVRQCGHAHLSLLTQLCSTLDVTTCSQTGELQCKDAKSPEDYYKTDVYVER